MLSVGKKTSKNKKPETPVKCHKPRYGLHFHWILVELFAGGRNALCLKGT